MGNSGRIKNLREILNLPEVEIIEELILPGGLSGKRHVLRNAETANNLNKLYSMG